MKSYNEILAALEARKDRSAWNKGVTAYAIDLLDQYQERAQYEGREAASHKELEYIKKAPPGMPEALEDRGYF